MALSTIQFFGSIDKKDGKIVSEYPTWMHLRQMETLREDHDILTRQIDSGTLRDDVLAQTIADRDNAKERLDQMSNDRPAISDSQKNEIHDLMTKTLAPGIREHMASDYEMKKGFQDVHEEARVMVEPCISIQGATTLAKNCGVRVTDGMVSRNGAQKMYKMLGAAAGMSPNDYNTERLRKPDNHSAYRIEPKLEEMV